jgi:hypothetical protein
MTFCNRLFTTFWLVTTLSMPASSETGIEFSEMPVGCKWHLEYSDGWRAVSEFVGQEADFYVVETRSWDSEGSIAFRSEFDDKGLLVNRFKSDGYWEKFEPSACPATEYRCTHRYRASDGSDFYIENVTKKKGAIYVVQSSVVGGGSYDDEQFQLGPFGIKVDVRSLSSRIQVVKFENCGD